MVYKMPQVGKTVAAKITRIEAKTAGEVFKSKATGKYEGTYSKASDKVYVIYGKVEGSNEEQRLGTVNAPRNPSGILYGTSKLYLLLVKAGFDPSAGATISDDLHELKGRTVQATVDSKGFVRL
jgi:hypothetical protein